MGFLPKTETEIFTEIYLEVGFGPGSPLMLGLEYMWSRGHPTYTTREIEGDIVAGLAPEPQLEEGQGVTVTRGRACENLDSFKKYYEALDAKNFSDSSIQGSDCPRLYEKVVVTGPFASEDLYSPDGSIFLTYDQVEMLDGRRLWIRAGNVKFKDK